MREIKFKGKRKDNGEWEKGGCFSNPFQVFIIDQMDFFEVIPETVGQFTGLTDKNGKPDWVGDIVKARVGMSVYYRPIFQSESGAFCINLPTLGATGGEDAIMLITCDHENVGNVHDGQGDQR